jgi:hypothetical protein
MTKWQAQKGLERAVRLKRPEARFREFLDAGADVNALNEHGRTPLHEACLQRHTAIARLLLDAGADVNARNDDGETPLDLAMELPPDIPAREKLLDLFREYAPEMVMEAYCTQA